MSFLKYDYHTHTLYCHHADFTVEELVLKAIAAGMTEIGISEHVFSEFQKRRYGLADYAEFLKYKAEVRQIKAKYAKQINVLVGLEVEVIDQISGKIPAALNNQLATETDFILYAFHYYNTGERFNEVPWTTERAQFIIDTINEVVRVNNVRYFAHPDSFMTGAKQFDKDAQAVASAIGKTAQRHNIILGFNINGLAYQFDYPSLDFWKEIAKYNVDVKIELDAHSNVQFAPEHYAKAKQITADLGLKVIDQIDWKSHK